MSMEELPKQMQHLDVARAIESSPEKEPVFDAESKDALRALGQRIAQAQKTPTKAVPEPDAPASDQPVAHQTEADLLSSSLRETIKSKSAAQRSTEETQPANPPAETTSLAQDEGAVTTTLEQTKEVQEALVVVRSTIEKAIGVLATLLSNAELKANQLLESVQLPIPRRGLRLNLDLDQETQEIAETVARMVQIAQQYQPSKGSSSSGDGTQYLDPTPYERLCGEALSRATTILQEAEQQAQAILADAQQQVAQKTAAAQTATQEPAVVSQATVAPASNETAAAETGTPLSRLFQSYKEKNAAVFSRTIKEIFDITKGKLPTEEEFNDFERALRHPLNWYLGTGKTGPTITMFDWESDPHTTLAALRELCEEFAELPENIQKIEDRNEFIASLKKAYWDVVDELANVRTEKLGIKRPKERASLAEQLADYQAQRELIERLHPLLLRAERYLDWAQRVGLDPTELTRPLEGSHEA